VHEESKEREVMKELAGSDKYNGMQLNVSVRVEDFSII
jgi:hypothetical protein